MATMGYGGFIPAAARKRAASGRKILAARKAKRAATYAVKKKAAIPKVAWGDKSLGKVLGRNVSRGGALGALLVGLLLKGMVSKQIQGSQQAGMQNVQLEHLQQMGQMGGADQYYAAALPELQQERQMAQQALMQMILGGGQGIPLQVPGERVIGGQGGGFGGY